MTITLNSGYPASNVLSPISNGALLVVWARHSGSGAPVSCVDNNGIVPSFTLQGQYQDSTNGEQHAIWSGVATSAGTPSVSVLFNGSPTTFYAMSLVFSGTQHWRLVGTQGITNASGTAVTYPTLTSDASSDQAYLAAMVVEQSGNNDPSTGFTIWLDSGSNPTIYDLGLASSTQYSPTSTQTPAGWSSGIAVIFSADASNAHNGTGSLAGTFTGTAIGVLKFPGTGAFAGACSGLATGVLRLTATASLLGGFTGSAQGVIKLSGTGALTGSFASAAAGGLAGSGSFLGAFAGSAVGSVQLVGTGSVVGSFTGVGTGTLQYNGTGQLAGSFAAAGMGTATLPATGSLVGGFTSIGSGAVVLSATGQITGSFTGTAGGVYAATGALQASLLGTGVAVVTISGTGFLTAAFTVAGTGTVTTVLSAAGGLSGTFVGSATGTVGGGSFSAVGTLFGVFAVAGTGTIVFPLGVSGQILLSTRPSAIIALNTDVRTAGVLASISSAATITIEREPMPTAGVPMTIDALFRDADGNPIDYPTVEFAYTVNRPPPTGAWPVTLTYASGGSGMSVILRSATGAYSITVPTAGLGGTWRYGWRGLDAAGNVQAETEEVVSLQTTAPGLWT